MKAANWHITGGLKLINVRNEFVQDHRYFFSPGHCKSDLGFLFIAGHLSKWVCIWLFIMRSMAFENFCSFHNSGWRRRRCPGSSLRKSCRLETILCKYWRHCETGSNWWDGGKGLTSLLLVNCICSLQLSVLKTICSTHHKESYPGFACPKSCQQFVYALK